MSALAFHIAQPLAIDLGPRPAGYWIMFLEEGSELMVVTLLVVMAGARPRGSHTAPPVRRILVAALGVTCGGVMLGGIALLPMTHLVRETAVTDRGPTLYHGPLAAVTQEAHVRHAWLAAVDVWAFIKSDGLGTVYLRLTPTGASQPIRESSADVTHRPWSDGRVRFRFDPIPDSAGQTYDVTVGALPDSPAWVFIGLAQHDPRAGRADAWGNHLALRTYWAASGPRLLWRTITTVMRDPGLLLLLGFTFVTYASWIGAALLTLRYTRRSFRRCYTPGLRRRYFGGEG